MNTEKLLRGESKNIEYKSVLPEQSKNTSRALSLLPIPKAAKF